MLEDAASKKKSWVQQSTFDIVESQESISLYLAIFKELSLHMIRKLVVRKFCDVFFFNDQSRVDCNMELAKVSLF